MTACRLEGHHLDVESGPTARIRLSSCHLPDASSEVKQRDDHHPCNGHVKGSVGQEVRGKRKPLAAAFGIISPPVKHHEDHLPARQSCSLLANTNAPGCGRSLIDWKRMHRAGAIQRTLTKALVYTSLSFLAPGFPATTATIEYNARSIQTRPPPVYHEKNDLETCGNTACFEIYDKMKMPRDNVHVPVGFTSAAVEFATAAISAFMYASICRQQRTNSIVILFNRCSKYL